MSGCCGSGAALPNHTAALAATHLAAALAESVGGRAGSGLALGQLQAGGRGEGVQQGALSVGALG